MLMTLLTFCYVSLGVTIIAGIIPRGVLAFVTPVTLNIHSSKSSISATDGPEPQLEIDALTNNDQNFDSHFRPYLSKKHVSNLLSVCNELQSSRCREIDWADSCKIVAGQQQDGSPTTVIANRDIKKGDIITLFPIHAIGLLNVQESKDGIEYIDFASEEDNELFNKDVEGIIKLNVPVSLKQDQAHQDGKVKLSRNPISIAVGKKPFIRMFTISLPGKELMPGSLGGMIPTSTTTNEANCVTLPLPYASPFCTVVATKEIQEGDDIIRATESLGWDLEEELNGIVATQQRSNILMLRNQLQNAFVGPFRQINLDYPGVKRIHSNPDIYTIENFLSPDECDRLIAKATPYVEKEMLYDAEKHEYVLNPEKKYENAMIPSKEIPTIINKLTNMANCSRSEVGHTMILHYEEGERQSISPHIDTGMMTESELFDCSRRKSDINTYYRWAVVFCYLNDVSEEGGGTTYFPELDLHIKPKKGTGLIHFMSDLHGRTDERTLHMGIPAIDEKWVVVMTLYNTTDASFEYIEHMLDPMSNDII